MAKKTSDHKFANDPPMQQKYSTPVLGMEAGTTAKPLDDRCINDQPGNSGVLDEVAGAGRAGRPMHDDTRSHADWPSQTNGRGR